MDSSAIDAKLFVLSISEQKVQDFAGTTTDSGPYLRQLPDEALLKLIQAGDKEALSYLFRRYARAMHALGRRILRDTTEAEDLVQEVFLYIHRKCALFDSSKSSARSWIFQIAYTQAFLRRRQLKSQGFCASGMADKLPESGRQTSSGADYDHSVEGLFGRDRWRKVLEALSREQREKKPAMVPGRWRRRRKPSSDGWTGGKQVLQAAKRERGKKLAADSGIRIDGQKSGGGRFGCRLRRPCCWPWLWA